MRIRGPLLLATTLLVAACGQDPPPVAGDRPTDRPQGAPELSAPPLPVLADESVLLPDGRALRLQAGKKTATDDGTIMEGTLVGAPYGGSGAVLAGDRLWYTAQRLAKKINQRASWADNGIGDGDPMFTPELWAFDTTTGANAKVLDGAMTIAARADGLLAYAKGVEDVVRNGRRWMAHVAVAQVPGVAAQTWTEEPMYVPVMLGWAGSTLLVQEGLADDEGGQLVALDGPGKVRLLSSGSLVAISPDGTRVAVTEGGASAEQRLAVRDVTTGNELARYEGGATIFDDGAWRGSHIVAPYDHEGERRAGIGVFEVTDGAVRLAKVIEAPRDLRHGLQPPMAFVDDDTVAAVGQLSDGTTATSMTLPRFYLTCSIETGRCKRSAGRSELSLRLVVNPSR